MLLYPLPGLPTFSLELVSCLHPVCVASPHRNPVPPTLHQWVPQSWDLCPLLRSALGLQHHRVPCRSRPGLLVFHLDVPSASCLPPHFSSSQEDLFKMHRASSARTSRAPHSSLGHDQTPELGIQSPLWFGSNYIPSPPPRPPGPDYWALGPEAFLHSHTHLPECALLSPASSAVSLLLT